MMERRVNMRLLMSMRQVFTRPVFDFLKINIDIFAGNTAVVLSDSQVREIYDIAENIGYSSPVYFSIMFKKQLGI